MDDKKLKELAAKLRENGLPEGTPVFHARYVMGGERVLPWWWLSFASEDGFLGVCIVQGGGMMAAHMQACMLGCNPGGQIVGFEAPPAALAKIPDSMRNRLLTREEAESLQGKSMCDMTEEELGNVMSHGETVDED